MSEVLTSDPIPVETDAGAPRVDRRWEWVGLAIVLLVAAWLRLWRLDQNGFANFYYSAAIRSMLESWSNFFYGSFDPLGIVTVDKPPVALWIQALSARLLGFNGVAILLPQALMGVASVWLTYHLVSRVFGAGAGLLSGLMMAITPVVVAVDRDNLPDPALVFVLLLAAWALMRSVDSGRIAPLLWSVALVGLGFNIKMLAAFVVLPTFYFVYLVAAPISIPRRFVNLTLATVVLVACSLSWSIVVELVPRDQRPYIGGSTNNSALELALGYNGLGRVFGGSGNPGFGGGGPGQGMRGPMTKGAFPKGARPARKRADPRNDEGPDDQGFPPFPPGGFGGPGPDDGPPGFPPGGPDNEGPPGFPPGGFARGMPPFPPGGAGGGPMGMGGPGRGGFGPPGMGGPGGGPPGFGGTPGIARFANPTLASQITWLFPLAILGAVVVSARMGSSLKVDRERATMLLWLGWLATHWVVFSFAQGIFHDYYTIILGPAVSALAGIGVVLMVRAWNERTPGRWILPLALVVTAAWQARVLAMFPGSGPWLWPVIGVGLAIGVTSLVMTLCGMKSTWARLGSGIAVASLLAAPGCWALGTALTPGFGMMPTATATAFFGQGGSPGGPGGMMGGPPGMDQPADARMIAFLKANRSNERIFVAAPGSMEVARIIIESGEPAVSIGGFMGGDAILSVEQFEAMVKRGEARFFLLGGGPPGGMPGGPDGGRGRGGDGMGGPPPGGGMGGPPGMGAGNAKLLEWVRQNGKPVDTKLWRSPEKSEGDPDKAEGGFGRAMRRMFMGGQLYDLRPELGQNTPTMAAR